MHNRFATFVLSALLLFSFGAIADQVPTTNKTLIKLNAFKKHCNDPAQIDPNKTLQFCKVCETLAKALNEKQEQILAIIQQGNAFYDLHQSDSALNAFYRALALSKDNPTLKGKVYFALGDFYENIANLTKSAYFLFQALKCFDQINDTLGIADTYRTLGFLKKKEEQFKQSLFYFEKAYQLRMAYSPKDSLNIAGAINNMGIVYLDFKDYSKAQSYFLKAQQWVKNIDNQRIKSILLNNLGITYENLGQHEKAYAYYYQALQIKIALNDLRGISSSYGNIGANYVKAKLYVKAIPWLKKSRNIAIQINNISYSITACRNLYQCYEGLKAYKNAFLYLDSTRNLEDSVVTADKSAQIAELEQQYASYKKDNQLHMLQVENLRAEHLAERNKTRYIVAVILGAIALGATIVLWIVIRKKTQAEKINEAHTRTIESTNSKLVQTLDELNNLTQVVAHDLKAPFNRVKGLTELALMDPTTNSEQRLYLEKTKTVADQGLNLIQDILTLQHVEDKTLELEAVLIEQYCHEILSTYIPLASKKKIKLTHHCHGGDVIVNLPIQPLTRIVDNLLSNAIKFTPAHNEVYIKVMVQKNELSITIQDSGPGFTEDDKKQIYRKFKRLSAQPTNGEASNGLGLAIVKQLTDQIGATLTLTDNTPSGSIFTLKLPIIN